MARRPESREWPWRRDRTERDGASTCRQACPSSFGVAQPKRRTGRKRGGRFEKSEVEMPLIPALCLPQAHVAVAPERSTDCRFGASAPRHERCRREVVGDRVQQKCRCVNPTRHCNSLLHVSNRRYAQVGSAHLFWLSLSLGRTCMTSPLTSHPTR